MTVPAKAKLITRLALAVAVAFGGDSAMAQTSVVPAHRYGWSENCGFLNWRDAGVPSGSAGATIGARFLSGWIWGENIGWINLGDGSPSNGDQYSNPLTGPITGVPDFGVNRDPMTGRLTGYAWGENVGWLNFAGGASATPPNPARIEPGAIRIRGYVWGENIGWINLDDAAVYVGVFCTADYNRSESLSVQDLFEFLAGYFGGDPRADINGVNGLSVQDIFDFLAAYFAGCA